jgi:hypothetical protein
MAIYAQEAEPLRIDLSDLKVDDIEVLVQEGARGIPDFAASSCNQCACGVCSCSV